MKKKVLVVAKDISTAMELVDIIGEDEVQLTFVDKSNFAIRHVRKYSYDVIILGDKLKDRGDSYDVGVEIKSSTRNKTTPVICVGMQPSRATKLVSLLRPYSLRADPKNVEEMKRKVSEWFKG